MGVPSHIQRLSNEALIEQVLELVNQVRAEHLQDPIDRLPCGSRESWGACPMANGLHTPSLRAIVTEDHLGFEQITGDGTWRRHGNRDLPPVCREFVHRFDRGLIPALIDPARPVSPDLAA